MTWRYCMSGNGDGVCVAPRTGPETVTVAAHIGRGRYVTELHLSLDDARTLALDILTAVAGTSTVVAEIPRDVAERFVEHAELVAIHGMGDPIAEVQALIGSALEGDG